MNIYLLERLRKFFKSVGKKKKINDLITNLKFKNNDNFTNFIDENFTQTKRYLIILNWQL